MSYADLLTIKNENLDDLILTRCADKIFTGMEGETIFLDLASGDYSRLDEVGTSVWNILKEPVSFQTIYLKIMDEYDVSEEVCRRDLLIFLNDLLKNKLITIT